MGYISNSVGHSESFFHFDFFDDSGYHSFNVVKLTVQPVVF